MSLSALLTVSAYAVLAAALLALEVAGARHPERFATAGRLLTWAMRRRSTQLGILFVWWWVGWHLVTAR